MFTELAIVTWIATVKGSSALDIVKEPTTNLTP